MTDIPIEKGTYLGNGPLVELFLHAFARGEVVSTEFNDVEILFIPRFKRNPNEIKERQ